MNIGFYLFRDADATENGNWNFDKRIYLVAIVFDDEKEFIYSLLV